MSRHTSGKWQSVRWCDSFKVEAVERTPGLPMVSDVGVVTDEADARLIAAAPDLLGAGKSLLSVLRDECSFPADADDDHIYDSMGSHMAEVYFATRAAIAKATGAQS